MSHISPGNNEWRNERVHDAQSHVLDSRSDPTSITVPVSGREEEGLDPEQGDNAAPFLLRRNASSAPQSDWRHLASLSFSALSGDTIWHQARDDRNR
jgi:hypothetical protein